MFKRILVAVDGSTTSTRGLELALALGEAHAATVHVVHVYNDMVSRAAYDSVGLDYVPADFIDGIRDRLRDVGSDVLGRAEKLAQQHGLVIVPVLVTTAGRSVADVILAEARKRRADVIVLGTHGRRGLTRLVMGSDAETIVRESPVPVLLIRSAARGHIAQPSKPAASREKPKTRRTEPPMKKVAQHPA